MTPSPYELRSTRGGTEAYSSDKNTASAAVFSYALLHLAERFGEQATYLKGCTATILQRYLFDGASQRIKMTLS